MKIAVLGGGGFIGSAIIDRLLLDGHCIRVFERPRIDSYRPFGAQEQVEWTNGDFMSQHDVRKAVSGVDTVMHLVSTTLPKSSNDDPIFDVQSNLVASVQLLRLMVEERVGKIVFISSGGTVYGQPRYLPMDELHPTEPQVSYGITKLAIEKYMSMFHRLHGLKPVILRVANPYGMRQRVETAQGAVAVFLDRALRGQPVEIWGGRKRRARLHPCLGRRRGLCQGLGVRRCRTGIQRGNRTRHLAERTGANHRIGHRAERQGGLQAGTTFRRSCQCP